MKSLVTLFVLLISSLSWASTEFGNGGNAVVCKNGSVYMYDTVEAVHRYSFMLKFPPIPGQKDCKVLKGNKIMCDTGTETAKAVASRIKDLDPALELKLQELIDGFWSEAMFTMGDLVPVNDTGLGFSVEGCEIKQLAIQHDPLFPEDFRYFIQFRFWNMMEDQDKAALILHEVLYHYSLQVNPQTNTSERIRYFNALMMSDRFKDMSPEYYQDIKNRVFNP